MEEKIYITVYIYKGDGLGIPGLPEILTEKEAQELGVLDILRAAIKAGIYQKSVPGKKEEKLDGI